MSSKRLSDALLQIVRNNTRAVQFGRGLWPTKDYHVIEQHYLCSPEAVIAADALGIPREHMMLRGKP